MLLIGCLFAFALAVAPRVVLVLAWIFSDRWQIVWGGQWVLPLLGIVFLPFTTVMYMLSWKPTGIHGWDWMWIGLGVFMDLMKWAQIAANRKGIPGYPKDQAYAGMPRAPVQQGCRSRWRIGRCRKGESQMGNQLVLAFVENEAAADASVNQIKSQDGASNDVKLGAIGVLVKNDNGKIKTDKLNQFGQGSDGAGKRAHPSILGLTQGSGNLDSFQKLLAHKLGNWSIIARATRLACGHTLPPRYRD